MHDKQIISEGKPIEKNSKVLIALHGRGSNARDILSLAKHLDTDQFSLLAPQATNHTWYPYSFIAPEAQNEPWLSSAIDLIHDVVKDLLTKGIPYEHIYFMGFSQGACLTLEYTTRHAHKYGGVIAFTGGLIGEKIDRTKYQGDFGGTPVFIGTSDPDFHVPVERVYATANVMREMGALVTEKVYPNMGHTIIPDEIKWANELLKSEKE